MLDNLIFRELKAFLLVHPINHHERNVLPKNVVGDFSLNFVQPHNLFSIDAVGSFQIPNPTTDLSANLFA